MVHANNAYSLRTQLAIARWGKGARYPLCLAGISLWSIENELRKVGNEIALLNGGSSSAELRKSKEQHWLLVYDKLYTVAFASFETELDSANVEAFGAYKRLKKLWHNGSSEAPLTDGQKRVLGILELLRDKVIKAAWAKGGAKAGYTEAAFDGDRPLSDDVWQRRLTASEIHSHLVSAGVFNGNGAKKGEELHEIRRVATRLGIRLVGDQRGPKHKPPYLLKPKKGPSPTGLPVGRPRQNFDVIKVADTDVAWAIEWKKAVHGIRPQAQRGATKRFWSHGLWNKREELKSKIVNEVEFYPCPQGSNWRTLCARHEPDIEPWRSPVFKAWMDSLANVRYPRWMVLRMWKWERYHLKKSVTRSREDDDRIGTGQAGRALAETPRAKMLALSPIRAVFAAAEREARQRDASEATEIEASLGKGLKTP